MENGMSKERMLAIEILESLPQTTELENEEWYEAEDIVTEILERRPQNERSNIQV